MPTKTKTMPPIHPGETLREDFLKPLGLTANRLATALFVPVTRINDIVRGGRSSRVPLRPSLRQKKEKKLFCRGATLHHRGHCLAPGSLLRNDAPVLDQPPVQLRSRIGAGCARLRANSRSEERRV